MIIGLIAQLNYLLFLLSSVLLVLLLVVVMFVLMLLTATPLMPNGCCRVIID